MDERRVRGQTQRIFLIDAQCKEKKLCFTVLGTTGNSYNVAMREPDRFGLCKWTCSCPDFVQRRKRCKHIFFIDDRLLKNCDFAKAVELIKAREFAPQLLAKQVQALQEAVARRPYVGEECAICTEEMNDQESTHWCSRVCGNSLHESCWKMWCQARGQAICPYCRAV